jgi:hypothetical protein
MIIKPTYISSPLGRVRGTRRVYKIGYERGALVT